MLLQFAESFKGFSNDVMFPKKSQNGRKLTSSGNRNAPAIVYYTFSRDLTHY